MNKKVLYQFSAFHVVLLKWQFCGSVVRSGPWDCAYCVSRLGNSPHFIDPEVPPLCSQRPSLIPILIRFSPVQSSPVRVLDFVLQSVYVWNRCLRVTFSDQTFVCLLYACHIPRLSHPTWSTRWSIRRRLSECCVTEGESISAACWASWQGSRSTCPSCAWFSDSYFRSQCFSKWEDPCSQSVSES
jgi:hypothetical protein